MTDRHHHSAASWREILLLSASMSVIAGATQAAITGFKQLVLGRIAFVSFDYAWMTPFAFVAVAVPSALVIAAVATIVRRPLRVPVVAGALSAVLVFSMLLPYGAVEWWAWAVVAAGAGVQLARFAGRAASGRWLTRLTSIAIVVAGVSAVIGVSVRAVRPWTSRLTSVALPGTTAPNVLVVVLDTVRSANLDVYGYNRPTSPGLSRLAAESTVFELAIASAPWTLPSHASLFTGRPGRDGGGGWLTPIRHDIPTLAEVLRDRGYATGGFVSNLRYTSYESGLSRGFTHYDDYRITWPLIYYHTPLTLMDIKSEVLEATSIRDGWRALLRSHITGAESSPDAGFRPADQVAAAFLEWQGGVAGRPFFAFLNFYDAHGPYRAPDSFVRAFARGNDRSELDRYDAAIAFADQVLEGALRTLDDRGVLDNTIVVVTSDHGEAFGEQGLRGHANSLYLPSLHVPLIVRYPPAVPKGRRVASLVSLEHVAATILELTGSGQHGLAGRSLSACWTEPDQPICGDVSADLARGENVHPPFRNSRGDMVSRFDERFHYIRDGDGREELYDYRADRSELRNLATDPSLNAVLARLRAAAVRQ